MVDVAPSLPPCEEIVVGSDDGGRLRFLVGGGWAEERVEEASEASVEGARLLVLGAVVASYYRPFERRWRLVRLIDGQIDGRWKDGATKPWDLQAHPNHGSMEENSGSGAVGEVMGSLEDIRLSRVVPTM